MKMRSKKPRSLLKKNGTKFYTVDDDDLDKTEGYYYSKNGIDFEPLDKMEVDSGHTKLYYYENNKWSQL